MDCRNWKINPFVTEKMAENKCFERCSDVEDKLGLLVETFFIFPCKMFMRSTVDNESPPEFQS